MYLDCIFCVLIIYTKVTSEKWGQENEVASSWDLLFQSKNLAIHYPIILSLPGCNRGGAPSCWKVVFGGRSGDLERKHVFSKIKTIFSNDDWPIKTKWTNHTINCQRASNCYLFTISDASLFSWGFSELPNSYVVFVYFSIHVKDALIRKHNTIKKQCV